VTHEHHRPSCRTHRKYGLGCEDFDDLAADHQDRCALCRCTGMESARGVLVIDHDFRYGDWAVRGLLCSRCNTRIDVAGRTRTPAELAYLADPWWRRRFARLGLPTEVEPEPAVGAVVTAGREWWKRTERGWEHSYVPMTSWRALTVKHAPYQIRVMGGQLALF
jgi:hypothetical protein